MAQKSKGGKSSRKVGRNKDKCEAYRREGRLFKNKLRRVRKHNGPDAAAEYEKKYYLGLRVA